MTDHATSIHLLSDELDAYFAGELPAERETLIEEHLADCDACTALARELCAPDPVLDHWTARAHGEANLRAAFESALEGTANRDPALRARVVEWRAAWPGLAEAAVHLAVDAPRAASRLVGELLSSLTRPGGMLRVAEAGPVRTRGPINTRGALRTRGEAQPGEPPAARGGAENHGAPDGVVEIRREGNALVVCLYGIAAGRRAPLVVLISVHETGNHRAQESAREPQGLHVARFENVGAGDYLVVIEPLKGLR